MEILLINPPIRLNTPPDAFPSGLGYIASVLIQEGHSVRVLDINANRYSKEEVEKKIYEYSYDVVGVGGLVTTYKYVKWLTLLLKRINQEKPIIVGGSVSSSIPQLLLEKTKADVAVIGEGEETIVELIKALEDGNKLDGITGIWFKSDGEIIQNPPRGLIHNLDKIPFPAWDLFPMEIYLSNPSSDYRFIRDMEVIGTRGCPYNCVYCYHGFGRSYRIRSSRNIVREIRLLKEKYGVGMISFADDNFLVNKGMISDFCDRLKKEELGIIWKAMMRVNLVDEEFLRTIKDGGCYRVGFGIESGSQTILDNMRKQITVEQIRNAIFLMRKVGLRLGATWMFGMIGEDEKTISETKELCRELKLYPEFFFTTPYPGTELYEMAKEMGCIPGDEEIYLEHLGDAHSFVVNLTEFSNEEFFKQKGMLEKSLKPNVFTRMVIFYKEYGLRLLLNRIQEEIEGSHN